MYTYILAPLAIIFCQAGHLCLYSGCQAGHIYIIYLGYSELYYIPIYLGYSELSVICWKGCCFQSTWQQQTFLGSGCQAAKNYITITFLEIKSCIGHWGEVVFGEGGPKDQTMGIWCFNIKFQIHAKIFQGGPLDRQIHLRRQISNPLLPIIKLKISICNKYESCMQCLSCGIEIIRTAKQEISKKYEIR